MGLFSIFPTILAAAPEAAEKAAEKAVEAASSVIDLAPLATLGAGLAIIGAARGIGGIGERACEGIARQPEAKGAIQGAMIVSAALIEGATFFALVICMMAL